MRASVFSQERPFEAPALTVPSGLRLNARMKMDGLAFLGKLPAGSVPVAFFDPQYRGVLDKLRYGNEGAKRCRARCALTQMSEAIIGEFIRGIDAALMPGGHAFLWMDKFHLCSGFSDWLAGTRLAVVDLLTWDKAGWAWVTGPGANASTWSCCKKSRAGQKACGRPTPFPMSS